MSLRYVSTNAGVCGKEMRTGNCTMDADHRGRHTTVSFYCDGCGKVRRGTPVGQYRNPWDGTTEAIFCFMCMRVEKS